MSRSCIASDKRCCFAAIASASHGTGSQIAISISSSVRTRAVIMHVRLRACVRCSVAVSSKGSECRCFMRDDISSIRV